LDEDIVFIDETQESSLKRKLNFSIILAVTFYQSFALRSYLN